MKNLAYGVVLTPPSPATSGTSMILQAGNGANFPAAPFDVTLWPSGQQPLISNAELARCTVISGDTMTLTREQYGTTAQTVVAGFQVQQAVTANLLTEASTNYLTPYTTKGDLLIASGSAAASRLGVGSDGQKLTARASASLGIEYEDLYNVVVESTTYTAKYNDFVLANANSAGFTITLPAARTSATVRIKKTDSTFNVVTIVPASGTIEGASSYLLYVPNQYVTLFCDGTNWWVGSSFNLSKVLLSSQIISAVSVTLTFPSQFNHLRIKAGLNSANSGDTLYMYFNNDQNANVYEYSAIEWSYAGSPTVSSLSQSGDWIFLGGEPGTGATSGTTQNLEIEIPFYSAHSSTFPYARIHSGFPDVAKPNAQGWVIDAYYKNKTNVTSVTVFSGSGQALTGPLYLYGEM